MKFSKRTRRLLCTVLSVMFVLSLCVCTAGAEEATAEDVHPYAWLGLTEIPKCNYLDILAANKYIRTMDYYVTGGICIEKTEAIDCINSYTDESGTKTYYVDGIILSLNELAKIYIKQDLSAIAEAAKTEMEQTIQQGINIYGRVFQATGKGAVPLYSEKGDTTEYEYYEYLTETPAGADGTPGSKLIERFYIKDGDIFAIYKLVELGETSTEITEVIKSMSTEIPEGTFTLPDLTGYTEYGA